MYKSKHLKKPESKISEGFNRNPEREARIAKAAYLRAEQRGFAPGHELEDWIMAEREIILSECSDCYSKKTVETPLLAA
jgi:Protein of unknown function (DUF2934)